MKKIERLPKVKNSMEAKWYRQKKGDSGVKFENRKFSDSKFDGNTFTTRMDPSSASSKYPVEYPIISNRSCPRVDVHYEGNVTDSDNTAGLATLDVNGPLYQSFDCYFVPVVMQYKGLGMNVTHYPVSTDEEKQQVEANIMNLEYNRSFARSCITALSAAYATQFTELKYLQMNCTTDIPAMYSGREATIGAAIAYQAIQQNVYGIISQYNTLQSYSDRLIAMGYNAEASRMLELTNLFKRAMVFSAFQQLGNILGEGFFDQAWADEYGAVGNIPSRRHDDMLSPAKAALAIHSIPKFTMSVGSSSPTTIWNSDAHDHFAVHLDLGASNPYRDQYYTLEGLIQHISMLLNPVFMLGFVRGYYFDNAHAMDYAKHMNPESYVNDLLECIRQLTHFMGTFNTAMVDFKTFMMLLQDRTSLNGWLFGSTIVEPSRPRNQCPWINYGLIDQLFTAYFTGGNDVSIDTVTRKWKITTLWDYDRGIPEFDYFEGGFAIAAGVRNAPSVSATDRNKNAPLYDFGVMFRMNPMVKLKYSNGNVTTPITDYQNGFAFTRRGDYAVLGRDVLTVNGIRNSGELARLLIVGDYAADASIVLPTVTLRGYTHAADVPKVLASNALRFMLAEFSCAGPVIAGVDDEVEYVLNTHTLSHTVVGIVSREYTDFAERAESYIRQTAPFRIASGNCTLGFTLR